MPVKPTKEDVSIKVKKVLAAHSHIPPKMAIMGSYILTGSPLMLDATELSAVAVELREYIKQHNSKGTIIVGEVKNWRLTVDGLITLVYDKLTD